MLFPLAINIAGHPALHGAPLSPTSVPLPLRCLLCRYFIVHRVPFAISEELDRAELAPPDIGDPSPLPPFFTATYLFVFATLPKFFRLIFTRYTTRQRANL